MSGIMSYFRGLSCRLGKNLVKIQNVNLDVVDKIYSEGQSLKDGVKEIVGCGLLYGLAWAAFKTAVVVNKIEKIAEEKTL
jgi:hypothetical protein